MLMTIRKITSFLLLMLLVLTVYAQENTASVKGVVKDDKGNPLEGVSVRAVNTSTNSGSGTQTNSLGAYSFQRLPAGTYSFTFTMIGLKAENMGGYSLGGGPNRYGKCNHERFLAVARSDYRCWIW